MTNEDVYFVVKINGRPKHQAWCEAMLQRFLSVLRLTFIDKHPLVNNFDIYKWRGDRFKIEKNYEQAHR